MRKKIVYVTIYSVLILMLNIVNASYIKQNSEDNNILIEQKYKNLESYDSPNIEWDKTYYGPSSENAVSFAETKDNNFLILGSRNSEENNIIVIRKIESSSNEKWSKTYGFGTPKKIINKNNEGFLILANNYDENDEEIKKFIIRINENGVENWRKTFDADNFDTINDVIIDKDNNFVFVGSKMNGLVDSDIWIIKTNTNGNIIWQKTYDNSEIVTKYQDTGWSIDELKNGGYIIAGSSTKISANSKTYCWLIKANKNGDKLSDKLYGDNFILSICVPTSVKEDLNGNIVVAGSKNKESDKTSTCYWIMKTDSSLNKIKEYKDTSNVEETESFNCVDTTFNSDYICVGTGITNNYPDFTFYSKIVKFNSYINSEWSKNYQNTILTDIKQTQDGAILAIGSIDGNVRAIKFEAENMPPFKPSRPSGTENGNSGTSYEYSTITTDYENENIYYKFDWGDGTNSEWVGPYNSGEPCEKKHTWSSQGTFEIRVKAKDINDNESPWSDSKSVTMPKQKILSFDSFENIKDIISSLFIYFSS